jgi:hypothetical protein
MNVAAELLESLPSGLPRVSEYNEFLRITKQPDTEAAFEQWAKLAVTLMKAVAGHG